MAAPVSFSRWLAGTRAVLPEFPSSSENPALIRPDINVLAIGNGLSTLSDLRQGRVGRPRLAPEAHCFSAGRAPLGGMKSALPSWWM